MSGTGAGKEESLFCCGFPRCYTLSVTNPCPPGQQRPCASIRKRETRVPPLGGLSQAAPRTILLKSARTLPVSFSVGYYFPLIRKYKQKYKKYLVPTENYKLQKALLRISMSFFWRGRFAVRLSGGAREDSRTIRNYPRSARP